MSTEVGENAHTEPAPQAHPAAHTPAADEADAPDRQPPGLAAAGPPARNSTASQDVEGIQALPRVLRIVGSVVAPTTLLTALMFYFGLLYAVAYYRYFGVNHTVLGLAVQDFLILSADAAVPPLTFLAGATLLAVAVLRLPVHRLSLRTRRILTRSLVPALTVAGAALVVMAAAEAYFGLPVFPAEFLEARGLSLSIGVLVIAYAAHLRHAAGSRANRTRQTAEGLVVATWASLFVLVAVGLFWAVGSYAIGAGTGNAQGFTAGLPCAPEVVVYSEKDIGLDATGIRAEQSSVPDGAYRFRYPGLRLVPQPGDQYLLLPSDWARGGRPAVLLPRGDSVRLEFLLGAC
jgi:hypothetical protein